jgi:aldehyde dehydrogenase (NAD+)
MSTVIDGGIPRYDLHIGGHAAPAAEGALLPSLNPTSGDVWANLADAGARDVDAAVEAAATAFYSAAWRGLSASKRGRILMRMAEATLEHADELARLESTDNGKLFREMQAQLNALPEWLYYFGGLADKIEGRVIPLSRQSVLNYTLREPVGVVAAIVPWNSPLLLTAMKVAPALAAGNTVVIKPSEHASVSILRAAAIWEEAGLPAGVVNVVTGGPETGKALVEHPQVAKISFTGGPGAGAQLAATAGSRLIPCTLELGGKSANIVFADANLDAAHSGVLAGIYGAAGQTCVAGSRALIHESIFDDFVAGLVKRAESVRLGDPFDARTEMGPIATTQQLQKIETMVGSAKDRGLEMLAGGDHAAIEGFPRGLFYRPTIVGRTTPEDPLFQEEVFGPVLAVIPFKDADDAVRLANRTRYGLAAGVWTENVRQAHETAQRLQAGTVWINTYRAITYNSPFGGYVGKQSGLGRENGLEGLEPYLQTKSVWCELSRDIPDPFTLKV